MSNRLYSFLLLILFVSCSNDTAILDIQPTSIHQTVPFYTGPKEMVSDLLAHINL